MGRTLYLRTPTKRSPRRPASSQAWRRRESGLIVPRPRRFPGIYCMGDDGQFDVDIGDGDGEWIINDDGEWEICGDCCFTPTPGDECGDCEDGAEGRTPLQYRVTLSGMGWSGGCIGGVGVSGGLSSAPGDLNGVYILNQRGGRACQWWVYGGHSGGQWNIYCNADCDGAPTSAKDSSGGWTVLLRRGGGRYRVQAYYFDPGYHWLFQFEAYTAADDGNCMTVRNVDNSAPHIWGNCSDSYLHSGSGGSATIAAI